MVTSDYKIEFASKAVNISLVEDFIDNVIKDHNIKEDLFGNILVAVTEGANNAIIHGNKEDESKKVTITVEDKDSKLTFFIEDEGEGFDPDSLPDPTAPENLEKPTGRGIFLIKQLADHALFHNNGRKVEIRFNIK